MFLYVLSVLSYWCLNICDLVANFNFFREFEERWNKIRSVVGTWLSKYLLAQSYQCKHKKKVWNMFKASNKDTRTTSITSFWGLTVKFEHISHLFLVFLLLTLSVYLGTGQICWKYLIFSNILKHFSNTF